MSLADGIDADAVIELLGLAAHPEGGWYAETWRDGASSAIWFLLRRGDRSHWHRVVGAVELWHHYLGDPLRLQTCAAEGAMVIEMLLGPDLAAGQRPQAIVPPGAWQSAEPLAGGGPEERHGYTLVGCTVAPPFTFDAFELAPPGWSPRSPTSATDEV